MEPMDPPFTSNRQALVFAAAVAAFLLLPVALGRSGLIERRHVWAAVPEKWGGFEFIHEQLFEEQAPIDLLVIATSQLYQGLDGPYLQRELSRRLGREVVLVVLPTNYRCEALNYTLLREMLARRTVRAVLWSPPFANNGDSLPHLQSYRWYLYGSEDEKALAGLPARYRWSFQAQVTLGAPRHLLSLARPNLMYRSGDYRKNFGTAAAEQGFTRKQPFVRFTPPAPLLRVEDMIVAPGSAWVRYAGPPLNAFQRHYIGLLMKTLRERRIPLLSVHVPAWVDRHDTVLKERVLWQQEFDMPLSVIGVPPAQLYAGFSEEEISHFYYNNYDWPNHHLNRNGREYYTRVVAPAIVEAYVRQVSPRRPQ